MLVVSRGVGGPGGSSGLASNRQAWASSWQAVVKAGGDYVRGELSLMYAGEFARNALVENWPISLKKKLNSPTRPQPNSPATAVAASIVVIVVQR